MSVGCLIINYQSLPSYALPKRVNYGSPRMHQELSQAGLTCCENTLAKLMKREGIRAKVTPKFKSKSSRPIPSTIYRLLPIDLPAGETTKASPIARQKDCLDTPASHRYSSVPAQ